MIDVPLMVHGVVGAVAGGVVCPSRQPDAIPEAPGGDAQGAVAWQPGKAAADQIAA